MNKLLSSTWISAPVGIIVYLAATVYFWQTPKLPPPSNELIAMMNGPSWDFSNPEADELITELKKEKKSLDLRQEQLDELATRLKSERAELGQVTQSVRQLESNFDGVIVRVNQDESGNLKKLAKVYNSMSPASAATVLEQMDNPTMVKILSYLKEDEAGAVLDAMAKQGEPQARRAAQISDLMRLVTRDPASK